MGMSYQEGDGVVQDFRQAVMWFLRFDILTFMFVCVYIYVYVYVLFFSLFVFVFVFFFII